MSNRIDRCAADRRTHERAWGPERAVAPDGLTRFQHRVEAALGEAGYAMAERAVAPLQGGAPDDLFVTGVVGSSRARVFVYRDGVELQGGDAALRLECRDVRDPDDMIRALVARLAEVDARAG
jgi:hypothetical protein